jgi:curli biogenesis system outer membrane secretion channel CsgG
VVEQNKEETYFELSVEDIVKVRGKREAETIKANYVVTGDIVEYTPEIKDGKRG